MGNFVEHWKFEKWLDRYRREKKWNVVADWWGKMCYYDKRRDVVCVGTNWDSLKLRDYKALLEHEVLHKCFDLCDANVLTDNFVHDLVINKMIGRPIWDAGMKMERELERVYGGRIFADEGEKVLNRITLIGAAPREEGERVWRVGCDKGFIEEECRDKFEEFMKVLETVRERGKLDERTYHVILSYFTGEVAKMDSKRVGDGPGETYAAEGVNDELVEVVKEVFKRLDVKVSDREKVSGLSGRRVSRGYIEERVLCELKPLESVKVEERVERVKEVLVVLDNSGSMQERSRAGVVKSIIAAMKECGFEFDLVSCNDYCGIRWFKSGEVSRWMLGRLVDTGDEGFDELEEVERGKYRYAVVFTDGMISGREMDGLERLMDGIERKVVVLAGGRSDINGRLRKFKVCEFKDGSVESVIGVAKVIKRVFEDRRR